MEEKEVLVKVEGLSKKFCKDLKTSLWYGVKDLFSNVQGNKSERQLREHEFWAVKDINFELRRGECLGLIGHNGAGKSTLLKILNGLIKPDAGKVTIKGRVGALIELGAGFNPILTGRENIYNNGAILGFTRKEINEKLEEIINFAEIREFIDMPVQNYSSGMKVRLGFAVAAQMEPDVLIIDEVLAVGDLGFVLKCFKTIDDILPHTAIIFVSHNMPMISRLCTQIIVLRGSKSIFSGAEVSKGLDLYYSQFSTNTKNIVFTDNSLKLKSIFIEGRKKMEALPQVKWGENLVLNIDFDVKTVIDDVLVINVIFTDMEQRPVARVEGDINCQDKSLNFSFCIKKLMLSKGIYDINLLLLKKSSGGPILRINSVQNFQLLHEKDVWEPLYLMGSVTKFKNVEFHD